MDWQQHHGSTATPWMDSNTMDQQQHHGLTATPWIKLGKSYILQRLACHCQRQQSGSEQLKSSFIKVLSHRPLNTILILYSHFFTGDELSLWSFSIPLPLGQPHSVFGATEFMQTLSQLSSILYIPTLWQHPTTAVRSPHTRTTLKGAVCMSTVSVTTTSPVSAT